MKYLHVNLKYEFITNKKYFIIIHTTVYKNMTYKIHTWVSRFSIQVFILEKGFLLNKNDNNNKKIDLLLLKKILP